MNRNYNNIDQIISEYKSNLKYSKLNDAENEEIADFVVMINKEFSANVQNISRKEKSLLMIKKSTFLFAIFSNFKTNPFPYLALTTVSVLFVIAIIFWNDNKLKNHTENSHSNPQIALKNDSQKVDNNVKIPEYGKQKNNNEIKSKVKLLQRNESLERILETKHIDLASRDFNSKNFQSIVNNELKISQNVLTKNQIKYIVQEKQIETGWILNSTNPDTLSKLVISYTSNDNKYSMIAKIIIRAKNQFDIQDSEITIKSDIDLENIYKKIAQEIYNTK